MKIRCPWHMLNIAVTMGAGPLLAATITWDGGPGGTGTNWNEAANWSGDVLPAASDAARFSATGLALNKVIVLGGSQAVERVLCDGYDKAFSIGAPSDVAAGYALTLSHVYRNSNVGGVQTLATDIALSTNSVWDIAAGYNSNLTVARGIRGDGFSLEKNNTGLLLLCGTNTYSGGTLVRQGTLELGFNQSGAPLTNLLNPAAPLELRGGTLKVSGKGGALNMQSVNGLALGAGASTLSIADGNASNKTRLSLGGIARAPGATVNFTPPTGNLTLSADNGYAVTNENDASGLLGAYATYGSTNWAVNAGSYLAPYSGFATLAGDAPDLADAPDANVRLSSASTGAVTLAAATVTVNSLFASDVAMRTVSIGAGQTLRLGALGGLLTTANAGMLTLDGGTLTAGGAANTAGELVFQNSSAISNTAAIADNGSGAVTLAKSGPGLLVLASPCTHTGGTFLNAGTNVLAGGANALATNGALSVSGGILNLSGGTLTNVASVAFLNGTVTNGAIVKFGSSYAAQAGTVTANLGGPAGLVKTTSGTLNAIGPNAYTGDTVVLEGTLVGGYVASGHQGDIAVNGNLVVGSPSGGLPAWYKNSTTSYSPYNCKAFNPAKSVTVYANGNVDFGSGDQYMNAGTAVTIYGGTVTGSQFYNRATVNMTGGSFGGNLYGGDFNVYTFACDNTAVFSAYMRNNHTFTVADGPAPIDLLLTGGNDTAGKSLTKAGAGVLALGPGGRSYTGSTVVSNGTLLVNNTNFVSGVGNAPLSVYAGATLGGTGYLGGVAGFGNANVTATGSVAGSITNRATVWPGSVDAVTGEHIIGTLTVGRLGVQTNNVTFGAHSTLRVNIATNGACDRLVVNGTLSLATATDQLALTVADAAALKPGTYALVTCQQLAAPGQTFDVQTLVDAKTGQPPKRGNIVYSETGLSYVVNPSGTLLELR